MKILLAFARKLKHPRFKRTSLLHKSRDKKLSTGSHTEVQEKFGSPHFSVEKPSFNVIPSDGNVTHILPPTYDECVRTPSTISTATSNYHDLEKIQVPYLTSENTPRGRTTQILYRSQLNGLAQRKSIRRPSPPQKRATVRHDPYGVDHPMIFRFQRSSCAWWKHLSGMCVAFMVAILCTALLSVYGF